VVDLVGEPGVSPSGFVVVFTLVVRGARTVLGAPEPGLLDAAVSGFFDPLASISSYFADVAAFADPIRLLPALVVLLEAVGPVLGAVFAVTFVAAVLLAVIEDGLEAAVAATLLLGNADDVGLVLAVAVVVVVVFLESLDGLLVVGARADTFAKDLVAAVDLAEVVAVLAAVVPLPGLPVAVLSCATPVFLAGSVVGLVLASTALTFGLVTLLDTGLPAAAAPFLAGLALLSSLSSF